jgi:hypothetical protein
MTEELKSEGKCLYCGKMFSQRGIGKHLAIHLAQMEKENKGNKLNYVHVEVEADEMFLHLLVKGDAQMPVVNSPRMGECGYEGGTIDIERDRPLIK